MTPKPRLILAIDDSLTIRKLLERTLQMAGYTLELAPTGKDGVERALAHPPDLVLLDYILPDMRGIDVCEHIMKACPGWKVPIILMSAKSQDIRASFSAYPSVVDYVGKPFSPADILFSVQHVIGPAIQPPPSSEKTAPAADELADRVVMAARAIFGVLKTRLDQIPKWHAHIKDEPPATFFGARILTPETVEQILTTLKEVQAVGGAGAGTEAVAHSTARSTVLQGETTLFSLIELFAHVRTRGFTGTLQMKQQSRESVVYLRRGEIVAASHNQPDAYLLQSPCKVPDMPGAEMKRALDLQIQTLKPVFVTWAEAGYLPSAELPHLLRHHSQEVLLSILESGPGHFSLIACDPLPDFVEAHGAPLSQEQLKLRRLRRVDDWSQVELRVGKLDMVFWRTDSFSKKLLQLELTEVERRVVTLVDGRNRVSTIIERAGYSPFEVFQAMYCMIQIGLLRNDRRYKDAASTGFAQAVTTRPIFVREPDVIGTLQPLERALRNRCPYPVINVNDELNLVDRMVREIPKLVLLNASNYDAEKIARDIRSRIEISDVAMGAILDIDDVARQDSLRAAGFNLVWVKPFALKDVELLVGI